MCDLLLFSFVVRVALIGIPSVKALFPTCYDLHFQGGLFPVSGEMNVFKILGCSPLATSKSILGNAIHVCE